jgi:2-hydroxychromene-2-carboxylate isomerase
MTTNLHKDLGGAATSDPSSLVRWVTSKMMRRAGNMERLVRLREKAERVRRRQGLPHRVEYFHQIDDPYSHLAAQLLKPLLTAYDIALVPWLTGPPSKRNAPEPELLSAYALKDARTVAPHYGLQFLDATRSPSIDKVQMAAGILAAAIDGDFPSAAVAVGDALWSDRQQGLPASADRYGRSDGIAAIAAGTKRRTKLGHYAGAMFHYGGEWYWGVDRLYHLENRLIELGAQRPGQAGLICPRPPIHVGELRDDGRLTLEFFLSLRSPYTSIVFERTLQLADETGVKLELRPVLPMVMRGVPVTRRKGIYIFTDTAREGRTLGLHWGNAYDPIGEPVRQAFSLYDWARSQGKAAVFLGAFIRAAFFEAVNTNTERGLRQVVEKAGLSWTEARSMVGKSGWEQELETNRLTMLSFGCWGVPTYRLFDRSGSVVLTTWGQDRLWLVAKEIRRLLSEG